MTLSRTPATHLAETVPPRYHRLYRRAKGLDGRPPSRTAALRVLCLECQGYADNVTRAIRECEVVCCPVYEVRPYQVADNLDDRDNRDDRDDQDQDNEPSTGGDRGSEPETIKSVSSADHDSLHQRRIEALVKARAARAANRKKDIQP